MKSPWNTFIIEFLSLASTEGLKDRLFDSLGSFVNGSFDIINDDVIIKK